MTPKITCPNCGPIAGKDVEIYNARIRKQDFELLPVLPTCRKCESEVTIEHCCSGGNLVVLNGTCGSGKSSVAIELMKNHGYHAIDGDCAIQSLKHKLGVSKIDYNSEQMLAEIACEIDILSAFGENIVLAQIILPEDMARYRELFAGKKLSFRFVLLKPDYDIAVARCQTRTCHKSITPEYWIKLFYDRLTSMDDDVIVMDNTDLSVRQTADRILLEMGQRPGAGESPVSL